MPFVGAASTSKSRTCRKPDLSSSTNSHSCRRDSLRSSSRRDSVRSSSLRSSLRSSRVSFLNRGGEDAPMLALGESSRNMFHSIKVLVGASAPDEELKNTESNDENCLKEDPAPRKSRRRHLGMKPPSDFGGDGLFRV